MSNKPGDLSLIFGRFAGREVDMLEETKVLDLPNLGIKQTITSVMPANPKDPVLEEMKSEAKKNGLSLRIWWDGIVGTMDYRTDRVNARIEKCGDGKWRVSSRFNIG